MMTGHRHVTQRCATHGRRLGGCRCITAENPVIEYVECNPFCPSAEPERLEERDDQ